jgi:hypothetical protein
MQENWLGSQRGLILIVKNTEVKKCKKKRTVTNKNILQMKTRSSCYHLLLEAIIRHALNFTKFKWNLIYFVYWKVLSLLYYYCHTIFHIKIFDIYTHTHISTLKPDYLSKGDCCDYTHFWVHVLCPETTTICNMTLLYIQ